jgi:hypothetical protein
MNFFQRIVRFFSPRRDAFLGPENRDWRKLIRQDVRRLPTDDLGRKRAARSRLPMVLALLFFGTLISIIFLSLGENPTAATNPVVTLKTDGFINLSAVQKVINSNAEGATRDVSSIKRDLEMDPQILSAGVRRKPDGSLEVTLQERVAVARIASIPAAGPMVLRLVSPEGVLFNGNGYPEQAIRNLPEIVDYRTSGSGDKTVVEGIEIAGPFLLLARTSYANHYKQWKTLSMRDCFGAQEDSPGSNLRVTLRTQQQPPDRPLLTEIVFSTANWRNELILLSRLDIDNLLRRPGLTANAYVLKLSIQNRTSSRPIPEPRLVPVTSR